MPYWEKDDYGHWRYPGEEAQRRRKHIEEQGLPVTLQYREKSSGFAYLECKPRPGFTHLSSPFTVQECEEAGKKYHITVGETKRLRRMNELANARVAWQRVKSAYLKPRKVRLQIYRVGFSSVARVKYEDPTFAPHLSALIFIRRHFGGHDCPDLTVSL